MVTTFTSRKLIRDAIKTLFDADGSWQAVYSGMPNYKVWSGNSPVCTILSNGTSTAFEGQDTNPRQHDFTITNWVLYRVLDNNGAVSWESDDAEDLLDALEMKSAQIIRNNAAGASVADRLQFADGKSQVNRAQVEGNVYITETRIVTATLNRGAI